MNNYKILDILYVNSNGDKKVESNILNPSEGYIPIGLCIAGTNFFGKNEPARFMSLKYMSLETPNIGSLFSEKIIYGNKDVCVNGEKQKVSKNGNEACFLKSISKPDWINPIGDICHDRHRTKICTFIKNNSVFKLNLRKLGNINKYVLTDIDGKNKTYNLVNSATEQLNWKTDNYLINIKEMGYTPAACSCWRYHTLGTQQGDWYLGAAGEISMLAILKNEINNKLINISSKYSNCISGLIDGFYWTSTENHIYYTYRVSLGDGTVDFTTKNNGRYVIALLQY